METGIPGGWNMKKAIIVLLAAIVLIASCATKPETIAVTRDYLDKNGIIEKFKKETGLYILEDVQAVEYFQNEISPGISILKFTLFLTENDAASVLAQKPPFSSEWTRADISRDFRDEWLNLQRQKLVPYEKIFKNEKIEPKPILEKGYVSKSGSLQDGDKTLKLLFVNRDYCTIVFYIMKNN
jgi:hypothetical protein